MSNDIRSDINTIVSRASKNIVSLRASEEATKTALILPFISALGYDIFDPDEVVPEFTSDVGTKKGEKVDYAIKSSGNPIIIIECKKLGEIPISGKCAGLDQLYRYFQNTRVDIAILTDGIIYCLFTDSKDKNVMDLDPFFCFDLSKIDAPTLSAISYISKNSFSFDKLMSLINGVKIYNHVQSTFCKNINEEMDDDFCKYFISGFYEGRFSPSVKTQYEPIIKSAILDCQIGGDYLDLSFVHKKPDIVTTQDELDALIIIRTILSVNGFDWKRISLIDAKTYCSVVIDGNTRNNLCRLFLDKKIMQVEISGIKYSLRDVYDLAGLADMIRQCEVIKSEQNTHPKE